MRATFFKTRKEADVHISKLDYDPSKDQLGCVITVEKVLQTLKSFAMCSEIIVQKPFIDSTVAIIRDWIETFEGND